MALCDFGNHDTLLEPPFFHLTVFTLHGKNSKLKFSKFYYIKLLWKLWNYVSIYLNIFKMLSLNICIHFRIYLKITTYFEKKKKIEPQRFYDFYLSSCWHHRRLVGFKHLGSPYFMYFSSKLLPYLKWAMNFFFRKFVQCLLY